MAQGTHDFVWYELMTTDLDAAAAFYAEVVGWRVADSGMAGRPYWLAHVGDRMLGGMMKLPAPGMAPAWVGYVAVDDVDAAAARLTAAGGTVTHPPTDIPGVGRFASVVDPQGAAFVLFTADSEASPALPYMTPGTVGWHELHAADSVAAFDFYAGQFGWRKDEAIDMGPMGVYQLIATSGDANGAMMTNPQRPPVWQFYFAVDDIDAANARVAAAGGTTLMGPMEVPGGMWVVNAHDPQGASFALVGMRT